MKPTDPQPSDRPEPGASGDDTSLHVRRALEGERASLEWIVEHFTPLLLAQARYRLGRHLQGLYDPEDLVQQVWAIALPRLGSIVARENRYTPVLLRFLGTVLLRNYQHLIEKHVSGKPATVNLAGPSSGDVQTVFDVAAVVTGVITSCMRRESVEKIGDILDSLSPAHREIFILRAIEELPYGLLAAKLGVEEGTLRMRYARALEELRHCLPPTMIDDLAEG